MLRALIVLFLLAGVAAADDPDESGGATASPPSKTLERGIKLYDKADYYSATIELKKVLDGESGDDAANKQRAEFFLGKAVTKAGFPVAGLAYFDRAIQAGDAHRYRDASVKWMVNSEHYYADTATVPRDLDPSAFDGVTADSLRFHMGVAALDKNRLSDVSASSPYRAEARLWLGRIYAKDSIALGPAELPKVDAAVVEYTQAASEVSLRAGVARELAAWAQELRQSGGDGPAAFAKVRGALLQLAPRDPVAAYYASRLALDATRFPGLVTMPIGAFDAVAITTGCGGSGSDARDAIVSAGAELTTRIDQLLALDDNAEIYQAMKRLDTTTPEGRALAQLVAEPRIANRIGYVEQLDRELRHITDSDKAWQTTQIAAEILQELTVQQAVAQAELGKAYRDILKYTRTYLNRFPFSMVFNGASAPLTIASGVKPGEGLAVSDEVCKAVGSGGGAAIASSQTTRAKGCGCGTGGGNAGLASLLVLGALTRRRRRQLGTP